MPFSLQTLERIEKTRVMFGPTNQPRHIKSFGISDDGAVSVDWVVLTGAVIGLAFVAFILVNNGAVSLATTVGDELSTAVVPGTGF